MAMSNQRFTIERELKKTLRECLQYLQQMDARAEVYPRQTDDLISYDGERSDSQVHSFNFAPMVCVLPERAQKKARNLYVVISGYLALSLESRAPFSTVRFGTKVGYFRDRDDRLTHVLGLHYDFDDELSNHPVYHAQLGSQIEFAANIQSAMRRYGSGDPVDNMSNIFGGSRIPTAQLDFFSTLVQVGADHLLGTEGSKEAIAAFHGLSASCAVVAGSGMHHSRFSESRERGCYRGEHWYGAA